MLVSISLDVVYGEETDLSLPAASARRDRRVDSIMPQHHEPSSEVGLSFRLPHLFPMGLPVLSIPDARLLRMGSLIFLGAFFLLLLVAVSVSLAIGIDSLLVLLVVRLDFLWMGCIILLSRQSLFLLSGDFVHLAHSSAYA